jgi:hypothetical protein
MCIVSQHSRKDLRPRRKARSTIRTRHYGLQSLTPQQISRFSLLRSPKDFKICIDYNNPSIHGDFHRSLFHSITITREIHPEYLVMEYDRSTVLPERWKVHKYLGRTLRETGYTNSHTSKRSYCQNNLRSSSWLLVSLATHFKDTEVAANEISPGIPSTWLTLSPETLHIILRK